MLPRLRICGAAMSRRFFCFLLCAAIGLGAVPALAQTPEADTLLSEAAELGRQGQFGQAVDAAGKALRLAELTFGKTGLPLLKPLKALAHLYELEGRYVEAGTLYRRALAILERSPAPDSKALADLRLSLAAIAAKLAAGQASSAEEGGTTARSLGRHTVQPSSPPPSSADEAGARTVWRPEARPTSPQPPVEVLPSFPWPPPASSARYPFPQETFSRYSTVGQVSDSILTALRTAGYVDYSFFQTGVGGVALVTRLEKIGDDGSPAAGTERWSAGIDTKPAGFVDFVRGLFYAKAGHYRVIVFIIQEASFTQSRETVTPQAAEDWLQTGANKLPPAFARRPYGKDSSCTALIYEFASEAGAVKGVATGLSGMQHLQKAGLLAALEKR